MSRRQIALLGAAAALAAALLSSRTLWIMRWKSSAPDRPHVVIVGGAGAVGLPSASLFLGSGGVDVTLYVRPGRVEQLKQPQFIYDLGRSVLTAVSGFAVASDVSEVAAAPRVDVLLIAMDTAAASSASGSQMLKELAAATKGKRDGKDAVVAAFHPMSDTERFYGDLGVAPERLVIGNYVLFSFAHGQLGEKGPTAADHPGIEKAGYIVKFPDPQVPFVLQSSGKLLAERDAHAAFNGLLAKAEMVTSTTPALPELTGAVLALEIAFGDASLWPLAPSAAGCVLGAHGSFLMRRLGENFGETLASGLLNFVHGTASPIDSAAFAASHHGGKVLEQDLMVLQGFVEKGKDAGVEMTPLENFIQTARNSKHQQ